MEEVNSDLRISTGSPGEKVCSVPQTQNKLGAVFQGRW